MARILKLPKQHQEAADKADAYLKGQPPAAPTENPEPSTTTVVEAVPQPEIKPVESPAPVAANPVQTPVVDKTQTVEYWEHRVKTMQGMFEADKTRMKVDLQASRDETRVLRDEVRKLTDKLSETITAVPIEYDLRKYFSEQEIEVQGEDNIRAILKAAAKLSREQTVQFVEREIADKVEPLKEKLAQTEKAESERRINDFWAHLNREIPNWSDINKDDKFIDWLKEGVPFTNHTRQDALTDAERSLDASRVVTIFKAFVNTAAQTQAAIDHRLERKVVPDSIPSVAVPSNEVPMISRSQVQEHYKLISLAQNNIERYPGGAAAAKAMEARISAAFRAGKIT